MIYINEQGEVLVLIADQHPFKEVENYFTNSLLYQNQLEAGPKLEVFDSDMRPMLN